MKLAAILLLCAVPAFLRPDQAPPTVVQTAIALDLVIDYDVPQITGTAALTIENVGEVPVTNVPLQIGRLMTVSAISNRSGAALTFTQDIVRYVDWPQMQVNQIHVDIQPLDPGERTTVQVSYSGTLVGYVETGMLYVRDHVDSAFTIIRTDARAFPQIGLPSLEALRGAPRRDFSFRARLTVPAGLTVVTPVPERERRTVDGQTTWTFTGNAPVPFLNIAVAPYDRLQRGGVRIFHFAEDSAGAKAVLEAVERSTARYRSWFGPLEHELELTVTEIPEGWGSQASLTGGIIQTADVFRRAGAQTGLYHELAHVWHPADLEHPSPRWNEGLASFLGQRMTLELDENGDMDGAMNIRAASLVARVAGRDGATVPMAEYGTQDMTGLSYSTGQLMFYVLFRVLGDDRFDEIIGAYFRAYRSSGSTTDQFVEFVTDRAPATSSVFRDWLYTVGWYEALRNGRKLSEVMAGYRAPNSSG